jgi:spore maturation protein SpmA
MALNYIWIAFFLIGFIVALGQLIFAGNAQIMFLVLNAAGLTIIPVSVMVYRMQLGAANPADIFIPILITIIVLFIVLAFIKKVNVYDAFIEGAKEGFNIAVRIIPFLVAILVAYLFFG